MKKRGSIVISIMLDKDNEQEEMCPGCKMPESECECDDYEEEDDEED